MRNIKVYRAFDEFLKDPNISLRAKGLLTMVLTNNITTGFEVENYCSDTKENIKDALLELRMNELLKYEIIKELVDRNGNKNRAAQKLGISRRQVDRLIIIYKEKGKSCFNHGNRGHKPQKTLDKLISENIILLYKNKYYDFNFNHFKNFLETKENIFVSYKFIYNTLTKEGILSPKARKKTKRGHINSCPLQGARHLNSCMC